MPVHSKILAFVAQCDDVNKLKSLIQNARDSSESAVANAALRKLISLVPSEQPGTVEHDFWQMIHVFEHVLTEERQKTTRLSRTRQKVKRVGVLQTLIDWALSDKETAGFKMLLDRGMADLTGEAIVLRHPGRFDPKVQAAARDRLVRAGVDVSTLPLGQ